MPLEAVKNKELKNIGYELFIGALSFLSILNIVLSFIYTNSQSLATVVLVMNALMTPIFLGDFIYRLSTAESKSGYFLRGFGWADLLSSLPLARAKILRVFRLWRVIRLLREFGVRNLWREYVEHRAENALLTVLFLVICLLEFGALGVLHAEGSSPDANITNASDALWWVYVTITTVGYGDQFPVTHAGRLVGVLVLTAGVGLFGTLSAFLASAFLSPRRKQAEPEAADTNDPKARLAELRRMVEAQEEAARMLKAKLAEFEKAL